MTIRGLYLFK